MIGLRVFVPFACWRRSHSSDLIESEIIPSPSTAYGMLLSLVGEYNRKRHIGCRITTGRMNPVVINTIFRSCWRAKDSNLPPGVSRNRIPNQQQIILNSDLMVWCDSSEERGADQLEDRVVNAVRHPETVVRGGPLSLGESDHLVSSYHLMPGATPPQACLTFLVGEEDGDSITLPVWVHYHHHMSVDSLGCLREILVAPNTSQLARITDT